MAGNVTSASATQLIVTVTTSPTSLGNLTATVTSNGISNGAAVQAGTLVWDSVVTCTTPDSATTLGTLLYALANVQSGVPITFESSLSGETITLSSTMAISTNVTITGLGAANLFISGNHMYQDFNISAGVTATISSLTVENGYVSGSGGGIENSGSLTLTSDTISGNTQTSGSSGGGIFNTTGGTLTLSNSTVTGNTAVYGGGSATVAS